MENNELKKVRIKNPTCCYFDEIIKLEDFENLCELELIK